MQTEVERLRRIRDKVIALEMEISVVEGDLSLSRLNVYNIKKMEKDLIFNIKLLRGKKIAVNMEQYKKSIDELKNVKNQLMRHDSQKSSLEKNLTIKKKSRNALMEIYNNLEHRINNTKVILIFDPRKRKTANEQ